MNANKRRIGIFGGSFHPPHKGHEEAALRFLEGAALSRLLIVPAFLPPHKELVGGASAQDRLEMARLSFLPLSEKISVSEIELDTHCARYTLDTLLDLKRTYADDELFLYVGSDMLFSFETWHEFKTIFSLCTLAVLAREGDAEKVCAHSQRLQNTYGARVLQLGECRTVSSTEVREALLCSGTSEQLSPAVLEYIQTHALYGVGKESFS